MKGAEGEQATVDWGVVVYTFILALGRSDDLGGKAQKGERGQHKYEI